MTRFPNWDHSEGIPSPMPDEFHGRVPAEDDWFDAGEFKASEPTDLYEEEEDEDGQLQ